MKHFINDLLFGRNSRLSGLIAFAVVGSIALGCTCGKNFDLANLSKADNTSVSTANDNPFSIDTASDDSGLPDPELLKALVAETTADFAYAVSSDDFSKLYAKASSDFRSSYSEAEMKSIFKDFTANKRVILPILLKANGLEPEFSPEPSIRTEQGLDIMVTNGKYDTKPVPVTFEYEYVYRDDEWKLLKLIVKLQ